MNELRKRLAGVAPELHESLERSWKIALEEWLPAIGPQMGSYNSYPHLRNLEQHLDRVVSAFEALPVARGRLNLRPVELYVLLSSILFHDVGRVQREKPHAPVSQELLEKRYAHLGIPSRELARTLGKLCVAHDPPEDWHRTDLYDVVVDPYGEVRERPLAALLTLVDHMDGAYTRVLPEYVKEANELETVGLFRSIVRGVQADCHAQMIRVELADMGENGGGMKKTGGKGTKPKKPPKTINYKFVEDDSTSNRRALNEWGVKKQQVKAIKTWHKQAKRDGLEDPETAISKTGAAQVKKLLGKLRKLFKGRKFEQPRSFPKAIWMPPHLAYPTPDCHLERVALSKRNTVFPEYFNTLSMLDWLVVHGLLQVSYNKNAPQTPSGSSSTDAEVCWPSSSLLAVLMHDVSENARALKEISDDLAILGVPLQAWLLEHQEHLYNCYGFETYEPVLDIDFLGRIAEAMWELSTCVFGCLRFSYEELAAQASEPDAAKVRIAVRRLAIVTRGFRIRDRENSEKTMNEPDTIWAGETSWRWNRRKKFPSGVHYEYLCRIIENLQSPCLTICRNSDGNLWQLRTSL